MEDPLANKYLYCTAACDSGRHSKGWARCLPDTGPVIRQDPTHVV